MLLSTNYFIVNVITKPEVAEHLIPNIRNFEYVYYTRQELRGGTPQEASEKDLVRVQMLVSRNRYAEVMKYVQQNYVKSYGAVCFYEEVNVPI